MPDTGAPWNIPYVAGTDLVADWPTDSQTLAEAVADSLDAASVGIGTNIVTAIKTDVQSTTSTSFVDVTDLSVTITPTSATNKVLVIAAVTMGNSSSSTTLVQMLRDATVIGSGTDGFGVTRTSDTTDVATIVYLDSPATTSATTYKIQFSTTANTAYINRGGATTTAVSSTMMAVEVAV